MFGRRYAWLLGMFTVAISFTLTLETTNLSIMGLFPFDGAWTGGPAILEAVQMAFEDINARSDMLPGYNLQLEWSNTMCEPGFGTNEMFHMLYNDPVKLMIIGAGCSPVSETTAQVSHMWNLVQISPSSVSPALDDHVRFPRFFRTSSPDTNMTPARVELMKEMNWKLVSVIQQPLELFTRSTEELILLMEQNGITLQALEIVHDNPTEQIKNLKDKDSRIVVVALYPDKALRMFCEAYKIGMYGEKYVWIMVGWYDYNWWETAGNVTCTRQQILTVLEGYIATGPFFLNPVQQKGIAGMTSHEFIKRFWNRVNNETLQGNKFAACSYDAAWAVALILNATNNRLPQTESNKNLEHFQYTDQKTADIMLEEAKSIMFLGVKGHVELDVDLPYMSKVQFSQLQSGSEVTVGQYRLSPIDREFKIFWDEDHSLYWQGGQVPYDSPQIVIKRQLVSLPAYITMCFFASFGIILASFFLAFNVAKRTNRIVKMSSPRLNNAMLVGCMIIYTTIFLEDLIGDENAFLSFCSAKRYTLLVGFSLAYGALFSKTWRIYYVFKNTHELKKKVVKDYHLLLMTGVITCINLSILISWQITSPSFVETTVIREQANLEEDVIMRCQYNTCSSTHKLPFVATICCFQGILLLFGAFLAYETRKVKIEALNESRHIAMSVYNVVIVSLVYSAITMALSTAVTVLYILHATLIWFGVTLTQCLIMLPRIHKHNNAVAGNTTSGIDCGQNAIECPSGQILDEKLKTAWRRLLEQETEIKTYKELLKLHTNNVTERTDKENVVAKFSSFQIGSAKCVDRDLNETAEMSDTQFINNDEQANDQTAKYKQNQVDLEMDDIKQSQKSSIESSVHEPVITVDEVT